MQVEPERHRGRKGRRQPPIPESHLQPWRPSLAGYGARPESIAFHAGDVAPPPRAEPVVAWPRALAPGKLSGGGLACRERGIHRLRWNSWPRNWGTRAGGK